jgi:hypothetical protein
MLKCPIKVFWVFQTADSLRVFQVSQLIQSDERSVEETSVTTVVLWSLCIGIKYYRYNMVCIITRILSSLCGHVKNIVQSSITFFIKQQSDSITINCVCMCRLIQQCQITPLGSRHALGKEYYVEKHKSFQSCVRR